MLNTEINTSFTVAFSNETLSLKFIEAKNDERIVDYLTKFANEVCNMNVSKANADTSIAFQSGLYHYLIKANGSVIGLLTMIDFPIRSVSFDGMKAIVGVYIERNYRSKGIFSFIIKYFQKYNVSGILLTPSQVYKHSDFYFSKGYNGVTVLSEEDFLITTDYVTRMLKKQFS